MKNKTFSITANLDGVPTPATFRFHSRDSRGVAMYRVACAGESAVFYMSEIRALIAPKPQA